MSKIYTGCLPRESKFGELCGAFRDRLAEQHSMQPIPENEWLDAMEEMTPPKTRPRIEDRMKNQSASNACGSAGTAQGMESAREESGQPYIELNMFSLYATARNGRNAGSSVDRNLQVASSQGICSTAVRTTDYKDWSTEITARGREKELVDAKRFRILEWADIESTADFFTALYYKFKVVYGYTTSRGGGHCICGVDLEILSGRRGKSVGIVSAGSYGPKYGDKGFHHQPFSTPAIGRFGAFAIMSVTEG